MIIDILPNSKLDIAKYLDRHHISVHQDFHKENRFKVKCVHDEFCGVLNELVMMKDFRRDDEISIAHKMDYQPEKMFIFENGHVSNLVYCKISNKKLFKHYMKELKNRRRSWNYHAIVIKSPTKPKTKKEQRLYDEIDPILQQCQISCKVLDKWQGLTQLRKDILKEIQEIKAKVDKQLANE
jgi:hypothetical protein